MPAQELIARLPARVRAHLANISDNLQLVADLGYGDAALAVPDAHGELVAVADARPATAGDPVPATRVGDALPRADEPEAYEAIAEGRPVLGTSRRLPGGVTGATDAYPIGFPQPFAVLLRTYGEQVETTASRMETAFIDAARDLMQTLRGGPLLGARGGRPFSTERHAGDGVLRVNPGGGVLYASPNAVTIMRLAGVEGRVTGMRASELPGGALGIAPMLGVPGAMATELEIGGRTLGYRAISLTAGALVLVDDLTEARRRERELGVEADDQGGPPPGQEQPADHRVAAAHAGQAQQQRRGAARVGRGRRARRFHGHRARHARALRPGVRGLRRGGAPRGRPGAQQRTG